MCGLTQGVVDLMLCLSWLILSLTLVMEQCHSRSNAHAPKSRMHKLDCKISRQKVLLGASGSDAGGAVIIGGAFDNHNINCVYNECLFIVIQLFYSPSLCSCSK